MSLNTEREWEELTDEERREFCLSLLGWKKFPEDENNQTFVWLSPTTHEQYHQSSFSLPNPLVDLSAYELFERYASEYGLSLYFEDADVNAGSTEGISCGYSLPFHEKEDGGLMQITQDAAEETARLCICRACYEAKKARDEWRSVIRK